MIGIIAVVLAIGGIILSLLYKHYQHAICYFLIAAGMSSLLYINKK